MSGGLRRAGEVTAGLAGAVFSFVPFTVSVLRSLTRGAAARARVESALARWDEAPESPPPSGRGSGGTVFFVAGEPSGDRLAGSVAAALSSRNPGVRMRGFGGSRMAAAGVRLDEDLAGDAVMGVTAVLRAAPRFIGLFARYLRILDDERPDCVVLVDYPGFNLRAAEAARRRGIPVVWYVAPQIWAWAPWRAARIGRAVDDLLVILPFERAFYEVEGVKATFVGYPLMADRDAESTKPELAARLLEGGRPVVALLPGSRRKEIEVNLPPLLRAAARAETLNPGLRFVLACAAPRLRSTIDRIIASAAVAVEVLDGEARTLLSVARAAICVSGTVTMECVHAGVPAVVIYGVGRIRRALLQRIVTVPRIALANLLAGRELYPEFTGPGDQSQAIAEAVVLRVVEGAERSRVGGDLASLRKRLYIKGTDERVAAAIENHLPQGS